MFGIIFLMRLSLRMDAFICTAETLCCCLKTFIVLLIGYTPIENKKFLKKDSISFIVLH